MASVIPLNTAGALDIASRQLESMRDRLMKNHRIFDIHVVLADELISNVEEILGQSEQQSAACMD